MNILEYRDLDLSGLRKPYQRVAEALARGDFRAAEVKKLAEGDYYRAKLDDANRLLFRIARHQGQCYILILDVIRQHAYDQSRFLRGAKIDETKLVLLAQPPTEPDLPELAYVNPANRHFHFLDKILSFDPVQQEIYELRLPLIVIGPAGSGKTAITLEKMKQARGRMLYVTLSPYLVENSRNLYYAQHYENEDQDLTFLSFREYLETLRVPEGREISYSQFAGWLGRFPKAQRVGDAHKLYEEFRGVITGPAVDKPYLSRTDYLELGVRQSIFLAEERELAYTLFEKYLAFLKDNRLYDPNILAHEYLSLVRPDYEFVVVDEVQDITNIQLKLILRSLKQPQNFLLCGDSNQIVHPNFFSWSHLKSLFYQAEELETGRITWILHANYRNVAAITDLANRLLKIKQRRFGSIDRESNYLIGNVGERAGGVELLPDSEAVKKEPNQKTRRSTRFAVLVMHDEQEAIATVKALRDSGVRISIDDYGTGYCSLGYLKRLPVNLLKIDKSFVKTLVEDQADQAIVRSTIELSHQLNVSVVAEGVEERGALDVLAAMGCDVVQGYYLSRPLPMDRLIGWLDQAAPGFREDRPR